MERSRRTDERLDDLAGGMRQGFARVDREFDRVHAELRELRQWMVRLTLGMTLGFISVLAAVLARAG